MGIFHRKTEVPPHPRPKKRVDLRLSPQNVEKLFGKNADFDHRTVTLAADGKTAEIYWIEGMVKQERVNDFLIRPLLTDAGNGSRRLEEVIWNLSAKPVKDMDDAAEQMVNGSCLLFVPGKQALAVSLATEEKRSITPPEVETAIKGPKDSFVESIRTNTSLVRRRLRTPYLRVDEQIVGRQTLTPVDVVWIDGITNPDFVMEAKKRIDQIDIDGMLATGDLEEYLADERASAFPQMVFTERPDRFCRGLLDGRVGILCDGQPMGCLIPGNVAEFLKAPQDRNWGWLAASGLSLVRYVCMLISVLLPAYYVAVATFHFEMLPTRLALSIVASKANVPFVTAIEVIGMLLAFEVLQEAGAQLPQSIGQTVSIIGGLVVGQAAVDAKIISPVVLIVVAVAGICGYTIPSRDFANALRAWRFLLTIGASVLGLYGMMAGLAALLYRLARMESFGIAYLSPYAPNAGAEVDQTGLIRLPMPMQKMRELFLSPRNRRKQR